MKKNNKILTVGIAAYNMELYLSRCLDSLVCIGNLNDVEILIVNDGSTDATLQIAQEYESLYSQSVKVIDKPNGGWGSVVNLVIQEATGKYFRLLDADDWYESDSFSEFVSRLSAISSDLVLSPYMLEYVEIGKKRLVPFQNVEVLEKFMIIVNLSNSVGEKIGLIYRLLLIVQKYFKKII